MKRSVAWHKEVLNRRRKSIARGQEHIDRMAHEQLADIADADALEAQIIHAEKEGLDAFDAARKLLKMEER